MMIQPRGKKSGKVILSWFLWETNSETEIYVQKVVLGSALWNNLYME